jgi:hypothetical protein
MLMPSTEEEARLFQLAVVPVMLRVFSLLLVFKSPSISVYILLCLALVYCSRLASRDPVP